MSINIQNTAAKVHIPLETGFAVGTKREGTASRQ